MSDALKFESYSFYYILLNRIPLSTVISVENVSKMYRLGEVGTGTLSHDLNRWYHRLRGKEDPYLKIGESNDRAKKASSEYVYALKDINFEVKEGEVLGIIGKNGAGKSTLLKLLSRVTGPSSGTIKIKGRTASLLEVGTGFHPELTGRENIFLNGAILGMTKSEIRRKFDEIVDFSGVERYIDTPVKRYSSGMYVRLAFAVAAFLESEILVVDEVLAVGDAEFQKKAIGKMQHISTGEGRTVLFVTHNMSSVRALCTAGIILEDGMISYRGKIDACVNKYLQIGQSHINSHYVNLESKLDFDILEVIVLKQQEEAKSFSFDQRVTLNLKIAQISIKKGLVLGFAVFDRQERKVFTSEIGININGYEKGERWYTVEFPKSLLSPNIYNISAVLHVPNVEMVRFVSNVVSFEIEETGSGFERYAGRDFGCVVLDCEWNQI